MSSQGLSSHLVKCRRCRTLMLNSDSECWLCGAQREAYLGFRAVALAGQWVFVVLVLGLAFVGFRYAATTVTERREDRALEQQIKQREEFKRLQEELEANERRKGVSAPFAN